MRACPPVWRSRMLVRIALLVGNALGATAILGGEHPRLLIAPADIPRLKHASGVGTAGVGRGAVRVRLGGAFPGTLALR